MTNRMIIRLCHEPHMNMDTKKDFFCHFRKKALTDNLTSWEVFEEKKVECHKHLDIADQEFEAIKKIFDLVAGIRYALASTSYSV